tara:strand:+ start:18412 stop:18696 length:285 start_codon:yes stop_codon:yes gene_type:complete
MQKKADKIQSLTRSDAKKEAVSGKKNASESHSRHNDEISLKPLSFVKNMKVDLLLTVRRATNQIMATSAAFLVDPDTRNETFEEHLGLTPYPLK